MQRIHNMASLHNLVRGGRAYRGGIPLANQKLLLEDFANTIDWGANTVLNKGYGGGNLAMVGFTRNDGTPAGGVSIVDGGMQFDGNSVSRVTSSNYAASITNFSMFFWIQRNQAGTAFTQELNGDSTTTDVGMFRIETGNNRLWYRFRDPVAGVDRTVTGTAGQIQVGPIYLVGVSVEDESGNSRIKFYIDGIQTNSFLQTGISTSPYRARMGSNFPGTIYYSYFFNRVLSLTEIQQLYNAGRNAYSPVRAGMVAQYSGRDFAGTTSSPTTIYDTQWIGQVSATDTRTVLRFNGAQYINYGAVLFGDSDSYTVLANYDLRNAAANHRIITTITGSTGDIRQPSLGFVNTGIARWSLRNTATTIFDADIAGTTTGRQQSSSFYNQPTGAMGLYKDAVLGATNTFTGTMQSGVNNTIIGAQSNSTSDQNLIADLQSLAVADFAATPSQIRGRRQKVRFKG